MKNRFFLSEEEIKAKVNFLSSAKCNHTPHKYIDITGDLVEGTLLARILYWFTEDKNKKTKVRIFKDGYFWIAKQRRDWWEEIRITERQYDKAIRELKNKGFVELAKYKFNSMPTIHIRPIYENINNAVSEWETRLEREITEENNPLSPEHENGNDIMCNSHGNNTKCKTGMTQEGNLLTMITDTDYLNRDYKKTLSGERAVCESEQSKEKETSNKTARKKEANALFEQLWSLYPLKKGKGNVSDSQKAKLLEIGYDELERAISRYIRYVESVDYLHYKNGSTFFNSGYIDYLDANYECSDNNNKPSVKVENYNNQKPEDETQSEQDFKTKIEQAKKKAIQVFKLDEDHWEGMDDLEAEAYLEMMGIL